jgi:indole-3-glycerol phosphate synthase
VGFLSDVIAETRADLERRPLDESRLMARCMALPPARDFAGALRGGDPAIIAEVKRASPSAGGFAATADPRRLAVAFQEGGAAAVSVLTERRHFDGALADLRTVHLTTTLPVLRKDFLVHPAQVLEARAEGADAVLLIAGPVSSAELGAMLATARDLGMAPLVEASDAEGLEEAVTTGADIIGVNARDLETLHVDPARALELIGRVPPDRTTVAESGISTREDILRAVEAGAGAVLVGEALMRAPDPVAALRHLRGALVGAGAEPPSGGDVTR